jgi:hypothetical protein
MGPVRTELGPVQTLRLVSTVLGSVAARGVSSSTEYTEPLALYRVLPRHVSTPFSTCLGITVEIGGDSQSTVVDKNGDNCGLTLHNPVISSTQWLKLAILTVDD